MTNDATPDLLVRTPGGLWRAPQEGAYGNEAQLRDLLAAQPSLIPGMTETSAAVTELTAPGTGSLDVAAVSRAGEIALVECKLASNPEIRREVVGQLLAYAAAFWRTDLGTFESAWHARAGMSLAASVLESGYEEDAAVEFRAAVDAALQDGRFRLILAVDSITPELRRTVEYLNAHTLDEISVLALELRYARQDGVEMIIPRVFGTEFANAVARKTTGPKRWTESDLFDYLRSDSDTAEQVGRRLYEYFRGRGSMWFGEGNRPSVTPTFQTSNGPCQPWSIYSGNPSVIGANFEYTKAFDDDARRAFAEGIAAIPGVVIDVESIAAAGFMRRPSIQIQGVLDQPDAIDSFIQAVETLLNSLPTSPGSGASPSYGEA